MEGITANSFKHNQGEKRKHTKPSGKIRETYSEKFYNDLGSFKKVSYYIMEVVQQKIKNITGNNEF